MKWREPHKLVAQQVVEEMGMCMIAVEDNFEHFLSIENSTVPGLYEYFVSRKSTTYRISKRWMCQGGGVWIQQLAESIFLLF